MLVPGGNQSDALSIGPVPDQHPGMVALQGDYQLLAPRHMYIYVCRADTCGTEYWLIDIDGIGTLTQCYSWKKREMEWSQFPAVTR